MVGLVFVSHSRALAEALVSLVRQVASQDLSIAIAAGVGDDRSEFGTDAIEIMEAIQSVYSDDGVLVLMDLGSAILSAETALDFLEPEIAAHVRFCPAPIVEGAVAAGVQAGLGSDLDTVCQEAQAALQPKIEQLLGSVVPSGAAAPPPPVEAVIGEEIVLTLRNLHGLHARPAAQFVKMAGSFDATVQVRNLTTGKGPVSARSLNALATLGVIQGHQITVTASGAQAEQALKGLSELVQANFGEPTEMPGDVAPVRAVTDLIVEPIEGAINLVAVSEGYAVGPFYRYQPALPPVSMDLAEDPAKEWKHLLRAVELTGLAIEARRKQLVATIGREEAAIFDAHELILQDPELISQAKKYIFEAHMNAGKAWDQSIQSIAENYRSLEDPYQKQRAIDVRDVGNQVLYTLAEKTTLGKIELPHPVILFAEELTPTETSQLDMEKVLGIITSGGGPTSHSAILARALGIPALSGASTALSRVRADTLIGINATTGQLWIDPNQAIQTELDSYRQEWLSKRKKLLQSSHALAALRTGQRVEVVANVGGLQDAKAAVENGAEGIGLLRTEFLFLTRSSAPDEADQYEMLQQIGETITNNKMNDWPMIVRTLDVGGDKELPYISLEPEANPFLGVRALRLCLRKPELFMPQLRAILRATADYRFRVMFPMVANLDEVLQAKSALEVAHAELSGEGTRHGWPIETGIMVEIPSAALMSEKIAPHIDFFSIGTNDLTQYTLAAERGNPALAGMADALHPAVLRLIHQIVEASHRFGKWTGICGELAGDAVAVPVLVGLGVDELSLNPAGIPRVKAILRNLDQEAAISLAQKVLQADGAAQARAIAREFIDQLQI